jgi:lambda family phage tail tape measure protein
MSGALGALNIDLSANTARFDSALERAAYLMKRSMHQMESAMDVAKDHAERLEGALGAIGASIEKLGAVAGVAGLIEVAKSSIESAVRLKEMSEQTGLSVAILSDMQREAQITGVSMGSVGEVAAKLGRAMWNAQEGLKSSKDAFKAMGVAVTDAHGRLRSSDAVLMDVAKSFVHMQNGAAKSAIAMQLFGRSGSELIPMLQRLGEEGQVNGFITDAQAEKAKRLEYAWQEMTWKLNQWKFTAIGAIAPALQGLLPILPALAAGAIGFLGVVKILPAAIEAVTASVKFLQAAFVTSGEVGVGVFAGLTDAVDGLTAAMAANPIGAVAVALTAAAAALYVFRNNVITLGGTTASVGEFIGGAWDAVRGAVVSALGALRDAFAGTSVAWSRFMAEMGIGWQSVESDFGKAVSVARTYLKDFVNVTIGFVWGGIQAVNVLVNGVADLVTRGFSSAMATARAFGKGFVAALHGDFGFTAFRAHLRGGVDAVKAFGGAVHQAITSAMNTDYVSLAGAMASHAWSTVAKDAAGRHARDLAEQRRRHAEEAAQEAALRNPSAPGAMKKGAHHAAHQAKIDPFAQALEGLAREKAALDASVYDWSQYHGKVDTAKQALAEFEITQGKLSDARRKAEGFAPLTAMQKAQYLAAAKAIDDETARLKQLRATQAFQSQMQGVDRGRQQDIAQRENALLLIGKTREQQAAMTEILDQQAKAQQRINEALAKGVHLTLAQQRAILASAVGYAQQVNALEAQKRKASEAFNNDPTLAIQAGLQQVAQSAVLTGAKIRQSIVGAFQSATSALVQFAETGKLNFRQLAASIIQDLLKIAAEKAMAGVAGLMSGASTGWIGAIGTFLSGARAAGGPVDAGGMYLVGERGPELVKMGASGTVVPNHQLRQAISGGTVSKGGASYHGDVNVVVNHDGSASLSGPQGAAAMQGVGAMIGEHVRQILLTEMRPGGLMNPA